MNWPAALPHHPSRCRHLAKGESIFGRSKVSLLALTIRVERWWCSVHRQAVFKLTGDVLRRLGAPPPSYATVFFLAPDHKVLFNVSRAQHAR